MSPTAPTRSDASHDEKSLLERVISTRGMSSVFQPIVNLETAEIIGFEALARLTDTETDINIGDLFDAASRYGRLSELESIARDRAFQAASQWAAEQLLFINNSPPVMAEHDFVESISSAASATHCPGASRVVVEITERTDYDDLDQLSERVQQLRERGFQVALDDVGAGVSGLNRMMALRPQWVKLDRELISGIDQDQLKRNLLHTLVQFARLSNVRLIAEGIERIEEVSVLAALGVTYGQGFYLGRPAAEIRDLTSEVRETVLELNRQAAARRIESPTTVRVSTLAQPVPCVDRTTPCDEVAERLDGSLHSEIAVVLDGRRYVGIAPRHLVDQMVDDCCSMMPVGDLKLEDASVVGADITLSEALDLVAAHGSQMVSHPLVVMEDGNVVGAVPLSELLRAAAETHRRLPSHVAALTGLPSRVQADQWLFHRIRASDPSNIAFIDLRNFDAYNATHGFDRGDAMLKTLVGTIRSTVVDPAGDDCFFAHLGEDRFMVATRADLSLLLENLIEAFAQLGQEFFLTSDLERGSFSRIDPNGVRRRHALTTLRVVYLESPLMHVSSQRDLYQTMRELRLASRGEQDGGIVRERRLPSSAVRRSA